MIGLTQRQSEILAYIRTFARLRGHPPSYREIADAFGFSSTNSVLCHVKALRAKGMVVSEDGKVRTIRVVSR